VAAVVGVLTLVLAVFTLVDSRGSEVKPQTPSGRLELAEVLVRNESPRATAAEDAGDSRSTEQTAQATPTIRRCSNR
jgi:hypothetical protein